jgi:hypothetical protein
MIELLISAICIMTYLRVLFLASLTSVLIGLPLTLPAQFRVHVGLGYDAAAGGQTFGEQTTFQSANSYTSEIAHTSLGQGLAVNAGATYLFDSHVGLDVSVGYLAGSTQGGYFLDGDREAADTFQTRQVRLVPSLLIQSGGENVNLYSRIGVIVPVSTRMTHYIQQTRFDYFSSGEDRVTEQDYEWSYNLGLGLQGGLGVEIPIGGLALFGELRLTNLEVAASERTMVNYTMDEENWLRDQTTAEIETIFFSEITEDNNNSFNDDFNSDDPAEELAPRHPFGSVGVVVGVKVDL